MGSSGTSSFKKGLVAVLDGKGGGQYDETEHAGQHADGDLFFFEKSLPDATDNHDTKGGNESEEQSDSCADEKRRLEQ